VSFNIGAGVFLVSLATLTLELLLTRLWGVLALYHFAFVAVSLAMFGLTVGAVLVYLYPNYFAEQKTKQQLATSSIWFAIAVVLSCLTQLVVPFVNSRSILGLYLALFLYVVAALPFCLSGVCITIAFTRFWMQIGKLYAADLAGAALGCLLLAFGLAVGDGPSMIFVVAAIAALGAYFFAKEADSSRMKKWAAVLALSFAAFASTNAVLAHKQMPLLSFMWSKGAREEELIYEKWNSFSRVTVTGDPQELSEAHGWGLSSTLSVLPKIRQLWMSMDSIIQTPLTEFSGKCEELQFLKYDVSNFAYFLKSRPRVLIAGVGGGRDALSALCSAAKSVVAIDINPDIISTLNGRFGDFTGHLDRRPGVSFVAEDARTYIARQKGVYDLMQISVIDTGVVSGSSALTLTENSLYTVEAWKEFLEHLSADGVISCTRWFDNNNPGEVERLVATARAALLNMGVQNPRANIVVVCSTVAPGRKDPKVAATLLIKRQPFTDAELQIVMTKAAELKFIVVLSPQQAENRVLEAVASGTADGGRAVGTLVNLEPATDNSPFFFYMMRPYDLLTTKPIPPAPYYEPDFTPFRQSVTCL
jgi:hypothetical protein